MAHVTCSNKAKMSALSKVGISVFSLLSRGLEAAGPMGVVVMSKPELNRIGILPHRSPQIWEGGIGCNLATFVSGSDTPNEDRAERK